MDQAPLTEAVSAPLPDELRPYVVLHSENALLPNGSRFGGHWVSAWRCNLPFVQIDRARTHAVGRCVPFADDGDPVAMRALLRDASVLIAADDTWLEEAAGEGTPTIYLADGHPHATELPPALQAFDPTRLRVLQSGTNFRRDMPLRKINEALEHFVPGVTGDDRSESSLCRDRLKPFLQGRIADLGHGGHKVHPDAVGVDFFKFDESDWIGDVRDLWFFDSESFDSVYSSHCLEDLWHPHQALAEWTRILRPGGHLSLFLPLRDFYPNVGTEGANPGHKDDYVPEDVEGFLRDIGGVEVVHSARVEAENSFEIVAKKQTARSYFMQRDERPRPQVSALIVLDPGEDPVQDAANVCATVAAAQRAFDDCEYEVLVLDRTRSDGDARAAVQDLAARDRRVCIVEDRTPLPYGQRWELLRRAATGEQLLILQPGTLLAPEAGALLREALQQGARAAIPTASDPLGRTLADEDTAGCCLLISSDAWPANALDDTPYSTVRLWQDLARTMQATTVAGARAITVGEHSRPLTARGPARRLFDAQRSEAGSDPMALAPCRSILVVMMRTLGDCVLATPVLSALRRRHPDARIEVLTEAAYAWIFAQHDSVDAVQTAAGLPANQMFLAEDRAVATAIERGSYDRLVLLSDRMESITYHHSGLSLADFYAIQAGVPEACGLPPEMQLSADAVQSWQQRRAQTGVDGPYAVVHTRAGWAEKSPTPEMMHRIVDELANAGLTPVVVGGQGEGVDHPSAKNLAGELSMEESAAAIAHAAMFVGPDSGPLHIASAFGVRSLALYGGSHVWVATPRAQGSCSVQAASCCPVPCGVTPCPERHCGAAGLSVDAVIPRLQAVVDDQVGEIDAYWGVDVARAVPSADGPYLVTADEQPFAAPPAQAIKKRQQGVRTRSEPAPVSSLPVELGMFALERHLQLLRAAPPTVGTCDDVGDVLEGVRSGTPPEAGLDVLRALAAQCNSIEQPGATLQTIAASIAHCGAMMRGERGRPRAAYRLWAAEMLHRSLHVAVPEPNGSELRDQLFDLYRSEIGAAPDLEHVLVAIGTLNEKLSSPALRSKLREMLREALVGAEVPHTQQLRHANLLRRLEDTDAALAVLDAHLHGLPQQARTEAAEVRFLRGTCRVAAGDAAGAIDDMRFAAQELASENDRRTAVQIIDKIERHLGSASAPA